jgi:putative transcriptional regulator
MNYSEAIKTLRHKMILSQMELAEELGVSFASVNRWEKGHFEPTIKVKRKIIELCKENNLLGE